MQPQTKKHSVIIYLAKTTVESLQVFQLPPIVQ